MNKHILILITALTISSIAMEAPEHTEFVITGEAPVQISHPPRIAKEKFFIRDLTQEEQRLAQDRWKKEKIDFIQALYDKHRKVQGLPPTPLAVDPDSIVKAYDGAMKYVLEELEKKQSK